MQMTLSNEFQLDLHTQQQIAQLLELCFPEEQFHGRTYFKQRPHYRLLLKDNENLMGQIALDYRVMLLNHQPIHVLGLIDVAVFPEFQGRGCATQLMFKLLEIAQNFHWNIDFLFLVSEHHAFYEKFGFQLTPQQVTWLVTVNHVNYGIKKEFVDDCLMYKQIGQKIWQDHAELDLLGYWY